MKNVFKLSFAVALLAGTSGFALAQPSSRADAAQIAALKQQVRTVAQTRKTEQVNLANFDDLDFNVYSAQKWEELGKSHAQDITVH